MRKTEYPINKVFTERWSPRAFSPISLSDDELMPLFEAARWSPSSYNEQPWHFIYAKRETKSWDRFLNLLVPFNKAWAQHSSVLVVVVSRKIFEKNNARSITHSFDTGAAWAHLALQATLNGLITHAMQGFDYTRAQEELSIPEDYTVQAMIAIGKRGSINNLSPELAEREFPSDRRPILESISEGTFNQK